MNSKTALLCGSVVLLLAGAGAGYLYGVDSTPMKITTVITTMTTTTTSTKVSTSLDAYGQVANSFSNHMLLLSSRNASAIVSQYQENASVTWTGNTYGLSGFYNGTSVVLLLMHASFLTRARSFDIGNVTRTILDVSDGSTVVNSSFDFYGQNYNFGLGGPYAASFNGTVSAQDFYVYSPSQGAWLISTETWDFVVFSLQYPPATAG